MADIKNTKQDKFVGQAKIYDKKGAEKGNITLPEAIFGTTWNESLVHQVLIGMESNARANTAHTKDRSEVRGGGRKPWRQKGTGSARHGSRRSPIWAGGGVAFGPRNERNYTKKINKKMRTSALFSALSKKFADGQILFTESLAVAEPSTKEVNNVLLSLAKISGFETLNTKKSNNILLVLPVSEDMMNTKKSFRNILQVNLAEVANLNVADLAKYRYVIFTDAERAVKILESKLKVTDNSSETSDEVKSDKE